MNRSMYIAIAALGYGVVCGSEQNINGEPQNNIANSLRPLAMVNTKERYVAYSYLKQNPKPEKATMIFHLPEIPRKFGLKRTEGRNKRDTISKDMEEIFGFWSMDKQAQKEQDKPSSDLENDLVLRANIEYVLGTAANTLAHNQDQNNQSNNQRYTNPNSLIKESQTEFENNSKENPKRSNNKTAANPSQQTHLNSIITQLYGPEIRTSNPETNKTENLTDNTSQTHNEASWQATKPSVLLYALYSFMSLLLLL